jgi:alpha-ketoglutaric semialdehyde dehydrogenase
MRRVCSVIDNPRAGFIGDPRAGLFYHPVVVDGVRHGDPDFRI